MNETELVIGDIVIPVGAGREISQSLNFIDNGDLRRTVNGTLRDLTRDENRKFESTISTSDMSSPAFDGLWKGQILSVDCIAQLRQTVEPASLTVDLIRPEVTGSVKGLRADGTIIDPDSIVFPTVTFLQTIVAVFYRPVLSMMIRGIQKDVGEYSAEENWSIDLEEV